MFFKSLKKEILVFILGLIIVTIFITIALAVSSIQTAGRAAEKATGDVLREQAEESLVQIVTSATNQQDLLFERVKYDASNFASYLKNIRENPSVFSRNAYWQFDTRVFQKNDRYVNNASDVSTIHIPSFVALDSHEKRNIERSAYLDFIAPGILKNNQNTAAIWAVDDKGVTRYFPNIMLGNIAPSDYDPRKDIFFKPAAPQENPDRSVVWSALYDDPAGQGLMITATAPVYTKNGFEGVVGIDVLLNSIIKTITAYSPIEGSYAFLIDKNGDTIAFPDKAYEDILGRSRKKGEVRINLANLSQEFSPILKEMMNGSTGFENIHSKERELFVAYAPLNQTGFSMAIVAEETVMLKAASVLRGEISHSVQNTIANQILPASLFIILFASIITIFLVTRIVKPVRQLTLGAYEIGKGNLDYKLEVHSKNEIGNLASSFIQMSQHLKQSRKELKEYSEGLEKKVKERTQELEQTNARLRELDQQKSEFVSIASHQLLAPLTAIKGYASMVIEGSYGDLSEKIREPMGRVLQSANHLVAIIGDFLNLSRIEKGMLSYQFARVDMEKLTRSVFQEFELHAKEKGLAISFLADPAGGCFTTVDEGKMRQIISNLIDNAIKYTPKGSVEIIVRNNHDTGKLVLSVEDTGTGIVPDDMRRLFQQFSRGKGRKFYTEGMGLGLYVAKEMMEAHHGRIWAESKGIGKGSKFFVELSAEK